MSAEHTIALETLVELLQERPCVVLSGAGCSTDSGIPDYRGPDGSLRRQQPIQFREFMSSETSRARYWARSLVGWPRFAASRPNAAHIAIAALEDAGFVRGVITQNVDELHQAAGSRTVVDLHGKLSEVRCMGCGRVTLRADMQHRMQEANADFDAAPDRYVADGDAELPVGSEQGFVVPACNACGGILKPDVVFFGENVPKERLARTWEIFDQGALLLVVGSSLAVFSGRRFVLKAVQEEKPVAIANFGPTRADDVATCKVEARLGDALPRLVSLLGVGAPQSARSTLS